MKNRVADYIPGNKDQFLKWLRNFVEQAVKSVNHYGINEEKIKFLNHRLMFFIQI